MTQLFRQGPRDYNRSGRARPSPPAAWTALAGGGCALGYLYLAHLSNLAGRVDVLNFLATHFAIAGVLAGYWFCCALSGREITYRAVIIWAILFRVIGVYGSPILEDDYFRYLLDGCVFVASGTPFGVAPASMFAGNSLPAECQILLSRVNNPHLPTIYGPVLQYIFAALHWLAPVQIKALQATLSLVDIALILLLCRHAPARYVILYAWCPLVVKEISFTAHPDLIGIALLVAAFHFRRFGRHDGRHGGRPAAVAMLVAMACAAKVFAVLLLPFLLWKLAARYWLLCAATVALLYAPFLWQGASDFAVLGVFLRHWQFNSGVFLLLANVIGESPARVVCFALFGGWWLFYFVAWARGKLTIGAPRGELIFGVFLLLSPVVNPWYVIWLLPFAVLRPGFWPWAWALAVPLSYLIGLNDLESGLGAYQVSPWATAGQIFIVGVALAVDGWHHTIKSKQVTRQ